jgi:3-oxoacyl-(acyl-carrier-protein) synthase
MTGHLLGGAGGIEVCIYGIGTASSGVTANN